MTYMICQIDVLKQYIFNFIARLLYYENFCSFPKYMLISFYIYENIKIHNM